MKILIVEDEEPAILRLKELISNSPEKIEICDQAQLGVTAVELIDKWHPDVVLMDIHLPDFNGFEVLNRASFCPYVIFTTAYAEHALKAFEYHAVDYLVKPVEQDKFNAAIRKYLVMNQGPARDVFQKLQVLIECGKQNKISTLPVKEKGRIRLISLDDIAYLKSEDKYVNAMLSNGKSVLLGKTLSELEMELPDNFHRVQRSYIVNRDFVSELERYFKGRFVLKLHDHHRTMIRTGELYNQKVKDIFGL
jgi:two-component system LytT family response regulator